MSDELKQELENVRVLLEAKDDLAYAPLLPLFRVECKHPCADGVWRETNRRYHLHCRDCDTWQPAYQDCPMGYVTRLDWLELEEGALVGPLQVCLLPMDLDLRLEPPNPATFGKWRVTISKLFQLRMLAQAYNESPNHAAVRALKEVLGG